MRKDAQLFHVWSPCLLESEQDPLAGPELCMQILCEQACCYKATLLLLKKQH